MCEDIKLKIEFTEEDLYKTLRKNDKEIIAHFYDSSIDDDKYFEYGIFSDIISNALSIQINKMSNNINSLGVDNNCRAIIEGLTILKMDKSGAISEEQKHLYRYQYALVDFANFDGLLSDSDKQHENYKQLWKDKEIAIEAAIKHFNCSREDLLSNVKKTRYDSPDFYLKKKLKEKIRFVDFIKDYPIFGEQSVQIYNLFSIFTHPRFELKLEFERMLYKIRANYIEIVEAAVFNFLIEQKLPIVVDHEENNVDGINEDLWQNADLKGNVSNMRLFEKTMFSIRQKLCFFDKGWDAFTCYYLDKCRPLILDMMIVLSLGYKEQAISKFKSFMEYTAAFSAINNADNEDDFKNLKKAFCLSSRLQFEELFSSMGINDIKITDNEDLKFLYEKHYKEKFSLDSFENFEKSIRSNSLYFLNGEETKSYNKLVKRAIEQLFVEESKANHVYAVFALANDMNHSSGYNFNASMGIWDMNQAVLAIAFDCLIKFSVMISLTLKEHGFENDVSVDIKQLFEFAKVSREELKATVEMYAKS